MSPIKIEVVFKGSLRLFLTHTSSAVARLWQNFRPRSGLIGVSLVLTLDHVETWCRVEMSSIAWDDASIFWVPGVVKQVLLQC